MNTQSLKYSNIFSYVESKPFLYQLLLDSHVFDLSVEKVCSSCGVGRMVIVACKNSNIGKVYKCTKKYCRKMESMLKGTIFEKLCLKKTIITVASWIRNKKISHLIEDCCIDEKTIYKIYAMVRERVQSYFLSNEIRLGGPGVVLEMDETHLFTRKYNRGNMLASEQIWVFGIFERGTNRCFLKVVENRDSETLFSIVNQVVHPESVIMGDQWRGYSLIKREFTTLHVNHRLHFVHPTNREVHTNNIERLWRSVKVDIIGVCNENYDKALNAFCFKRNYLTGNFYENLCLVLKTIK